MKAVLDFVLVTVALVAIVWSFYVQRRKRSTDRPHTRAWWASSSSRSHL